MERTRAYRRSQRNRVIARKKRIAEDITRGRVGWYNIEGKYSKGKIHCSCWMCSGKDVMGRHVLTKPEIIAINELRAAKQIYVGAVDKTA